MSVRTAQCPIDELRNPRLGWVKINLQDHSWYIPEENYHPLVTWVREEMLRQCKLEANDSEHLFASEERKVEFQLPSRA